MEWLLFTLFFVYVVFSWRTFSSIFSSVVKQKILQYSFINRLYTFLMLLEPNLRELKEFPCIKFKRIKRRKRFPYAKDLL